MKRTIITSTMLIVFGAFLIAQSSQNAIKASITRGEAVYKQFCLTCHQADGGGVPKMNSPLINTTYVTGEKKKLISWVLKGSADKVPIEGKYYSNNMAAQANLTDEQIADVLTYVRNSFGNKASALQSSEVKAVRATIK